jgi:D-alanyl-lipoteichoic acid acyltransferase DltB (MBOAT superfamily)
MRAVSPGFQPMLFSSHTFLFAFLPLMLVAYQVASVISGRLGGLTALAVGSVFFYCYREPNHLAVIVASLLMNYAAALALHRRRSQALAGLVVALNLAVIAYFKYSSMALGLVDAGWAERALSITLPLGISFHTFQQIAYVVDVQRGQKPETSLLRYLVFVTFFPQMIAGPIVHHGEMLPQLAGNGLGTLRRAAVAEGVSIFFIGLFKKVVLADSLDPFVAGFYNGVLAGVRPGLVESWAGALSYSFQIYFDFSGYSDMAIGLARLFNLRLPANFLSPYKAGSVIEFWRRWHITLSRFLRDYLYVPLGGNRHGTARRYANIFTVMLLGGLWHGAGWTFVAWGALHGAMICANHAWRDLGGRAVPGGGVLTFVGVSAAWVLFRSPDFATAAQVLTGMAGLNGVSVPTRYMSVLGPLSALGIRADDGMLFYGLGQLGWLAFAGAVTWAAPNSWQLFFGDAKAEGPRWRWQPTLPWAGAVCGMAVVALLLLRAPKEFIYFVF